MNRVLVALLNGVQFWSAYFAAECGALTPTFEEVGTEYVEYTAQYHVVGRGASI